jgi:hypothetical protein
VEDIIIIIFISINPVQTRMCLHIQGRRINQTRNQCEAGSKLGFCLLPANAGFLPGLFFDPEDGGDVPPKTAVRTSNPTHCSQYFTVQ